MIDTEQSELDALRKIEPTPDEDCPALTEEQLKQFYRVSELTTEKIAEMRRQGIKVSEFAARQVAEREQREREIDKQDYDAAMERYNANPISYSLDVIEKELKLKE